MGGRSSLNVANQTADQRLVAIDLLRGIIMVLMALDHTRMYFSNAHFNPLDLEKTTAALFLTRWITHFCAPLFIFLSGLSTYLSLANRSDRAAATRFLIARGGLLIVLEIVLLPWFGWSFGLAMDHITAGVLWAIGWSMIALAGFIRMPRGTVGVIGIAMMVGHNAFDAVSPDAFGALGWLWRILHAGGEFVYGPGWRFDALYPLIPWIGVMAAGYAFGPVLVRESGERQRVLRDLGAFLCVAFVVLRAGNLYGDPSFWKAFDSDVFTLLSFLDCKKYPPSLHYLLMTLGPGLLLLAALDRAAPRWLQPLNVFGQVPLFYYVLHIPLIHGFAALLDYGRYRQAAWQFGWPLVTPGAVEPPDQGFGLLIVYLSTAFIVCTLYPACRWFAGLKRTRRDLWWIRYI